MRETQKWDITGVLLFKVMLLFFILGAARRYPPVLMYVSGLVMTGVIFIVLSQSASFGVFALVCIINGMGFANYKTCGRTNTRTRVKKMHEKKSTRAGIFTHTHACMYTHTHTCTRIHGHTYMHTHTCTHAYICTLTCLHLFTHYLFNFTSSVACLSHSH